MRLPAPTWRLALLFVVVTLVATALPAVADTRAELEAAQAEVARLRAEADAATARYQDAYGALAETEDAIAAQEASLGATERRLTDLEERAALRAVEAYVGGSYEDPFGADADTALDAGRRSALLVDVASDDVDLVEQLGATREDLELLRRDLDALHAEQADHLAVMEAASAEIQDRLGRARDLEATLEARYAAELEEQRRREAEERARREAEERARREAEAAAAARARQATTGGGSGGSGSSGGGGGGGGGGSIPSGYACPVPGSSFVDSWGAPRSGGRRHQGVDMMAPFGTPNLAVTGGTVQGTSSALGGTSVYLYGDDGNTYYYAHLQRIVATGRVARGEVIGEGGASGNASGGSPHTHFEVHLGGGGAVNPTPYVRAWC